LVIAQRYRGIKKNYHPTNVVLIHLKMHVLNTMFIFFLVGLLYLLFDLEIIFLLPWVFAAGLLQSFNSFLVVLTFLGLLVLGFWYE